MNYKLPVSTQQILSGGYSSESVIEAELRTGNGDLIDALRVAGIAGPFESVNPWELKDENGVVRVYAGGYAASPFGERYQPLIQFMTQFLNEDKSMGLPQQSSSAWRAALEDGLIGLLASVAPSHKDSRVFLSNSGAEAIECAVKLAKASRQKSTKIINFKGGYHGKTFIPLSLTPNEEYQGMFRPLMPGVETIAYGDIQTFEATVKSLGPDTITCVILEPLQGEGGVVIPPDGFLRTVGGVCKKHGIFVIADEIQTGLGRCGTWFESIAQGLDPDIITLAKPLGGGLVPIGATIARNAIFKKMLGGLGSKRHSNTFGGGSLACAVALKSLEILIEEDLPTRSARMGAEGLERLKKIAAAHPKLIEAVRGKGMLFAIQFKPALPVATHGLVGELTSILGLYWLHQAGLHANLSLSSKRVVRLSPALNMPDEIWEKMWTCVEKFADEQENSFKMLRKAPPKMLTGLGMLSTRG